jgi:hypothetical protein
MSKGRKEGMREMKRKENRVEKCYKGHGNSIGSESKAVRKYRNNIRLINGNNENNE